LSAPEMVVIVTDNLRELAAQAALKGYVLMAPPEPGYTYIQSKAFNDASFQDEDKKVKPKKQKERKKFTKFYGEVWEEIGMRKALNPNEVYCITLLFPYCEINSNFLVSKHKGLQSKPLETEDIARIINREERQTKRILKSLMDKNLIFRGESGGCKKYCINPEIYWNGGDITQYGIFKTMFYSERDTKVGKAREQLKKLRVLNVNGKKTSMLLH